MPARGAVPRRLGLPMVAVAQVIAEVRAVAGSVRRWPHAVGRRSLGSPTVGATGDRRAQAWKREPNYGVGP